MPRIESVADFQCGARPNPFGTQGRASKFRRHAEEYDVPPGTRLAIPLRDLTVECTCLVVQVVPALPICDRVISTVHAATPCERFNWQVTPMASVFFPHTDPHAANAAAMHRVAAELRDHPARAGDLLWIRVERQTLSRLPDSNAVAFSLHTYSDPLSSIRSDPESVRAILALLRNYTEERWKYSEMDMVREPLLLWLDTAASTRG